MTKPLLAPLALALLTACVNETGVSGSDETGQADDGIEDGRGDAPGEAVALGETLVLGEVEITPESVVEDSRCPVDADCVWSGQIIVRTTIASAGRQETIEISNLEPQQVMRGTLSLTGAWPFNTSERGPAQDEYRFTYSFDYE